MTVMKNENPNNEKNRDEDNVLDFLEALEAFVCDEDRCDEDPYDIDGDCNESQPCRGDEYTGGYEFDLNTDEPEDLGDFCDSDYCDDEPEIDGDCNESQPYRGDEFTGDLDDLNCDECAA